MKRISNLLIAIGIILLIGTVGASDVGSIAFIQIMNQFLIGAALIVAGKFFGKLSAILKVKRRCTAVKAMPYMGDVK